MAKTKTYTGSGSRSESYPDVEIAEGKWLLEASSNFLTNTNLGLKSKESRTISVSIDNVDTENGIKMSGSDMAGKFDYLFDQIETYELENDRSAMYMDLNLNSVGEIKTEITATIKYGVLENEVLSSAIKNIHEAADYLEERVRELYYQSIVSEDGLAISAVWYASVTIESESVGLGFFTGTPYEIYFFSTDIALNPGMSPYCYPSSVCDTYLPLQVNAMQDYIDQLNIGSIAQLFECDYEVAYLPEPVPSETEGGCGNTESGKHVITELSYGVGLAY